MPARHVKLVAVLFLVAGATGAFSCAKGADTILVGGGDGGSGGASGNTGAGGDDSVVCPPHLANCGGVCVDRTTDAANCGGCGAACAAGEICEGAQCVCGPDWTVCGAVCTDTTADAAHCGACDSPCAAGGPHMTSTCKDSICGTACEAGFDDCNGSLADGCEKSTTTDPVNCGGCGAICPAPANTTVTCEDSMCVPGPCVSGFDDCDGNAANGCEASLLSTPAHCGACGAACPPGMSCASGACTDVDLTGVFSSYTSEGRQVHMWKTDMCAILANHTDFCQLRGLSWWKPKSQVDAQLLIDHAYNLDGNHTWIQVHGVTTDLNGTIEGFPVTVDSANCVEGSSTGWTAFRKWACSFCDPESNAQQQSDGQSCCWDKGHTYDWFVCEG